MSATTRVTKAMLIDENNALRNELNVLRNAYQAERALNAERSINEQHAASTPRTTMPVPRAKPAIPQWQYERAMQMKAARAKAMASGQMVLV